MSTTEVGADISGWDCVFALCFDFGLRILLMTFVRGRLPCVCHPRHAGVIRPVLDEAVEVGRGGDGEHEGDPKAAGVIGMLFVTPVYGEENDTNDERYHP